jgi:starch phosphorylase
MTATRFSLEVRPRIPAELARLPELASNLIYSWDRDLRRLFRHLDNRLYEECGGNLGLFLRRVPQATLDRAATDAAIVEVYRRVIESYDAYHAIRMSEPLAKSLDRATDLIAYFCFEFGFHESVPLYSGGLGILAGDHLKAASDLAVPVVGVGLLYHQGYFEQRLDRMGHQIEVYRTTRSEDLPFVPALDRTGHEMRVMVPVERQELALRIWTGQVGRARLFLLDTDVPENPAQLRSVTHRLYGGDHVTRIMQEIVLGVGGVRALRALGIDPTVWHLNEGHSAFQLIERCREHMVNGSTFDEALEIVAASTVFTTHTPVAAGHDVFEWRLIEQYVGPYLTASGMDVAKILDLGRNTEVSQLNMTSLALRGSRHRNGVSRVHGEVTARNEAHVWPEVPPEENPITWVTNGVHLQTFLALEWVNLFDTRFADWRSNLTNPEYWRCVGEIPDHQFWSVRQELCGQLFSEVHRRLVAQQHRAGTARSTVTRMTRLLEHPAERVLVLGFARRFATYKRAGLIFEDRARLARLLNDDERPVLLVMAGKAHPHDEPAKQLIRQIYDLSTQPEFLGRVLFIENYDLALARRLVAGVDVWLNTPEHPLEASGTSGMKAAMNGVINLSVLDGWWAEAWDGSNGWAIQPHDPSVERAFREREEARDLLETLEHEVIPLYFDRGAHDGWAAMAKASMRTVLPRFNAERMVRDYVQRMYAPAARHRRLLQADNARAARSLALWRRKVETCWDGVTLRIVQRPPERVDAGGHVRLEARLSLNGLEPSDVRVECLVCPETDDPRASSASAGASVVPFTVRAQTASAREATCHLDLLPPLPGLQTLRVRAYPYHELLTHPFEMGRMVWA